jgi:RNA polymerase sigma-70 factor, ECF subfamily
METTVLLAQCLAGDRDAIDEFVTHSYPKVFRLAASILDDPAEAAEATQEALLAALDGLASFQGNAALTTWLYTVTLNVCRGKLRKQRARQRLNQVLMGLFALKNFSPAVEEAIIQNEDSRRMWAAVQGLGEKHRIPVILRYYHDCSVAEIAGILQINEGTVHSRLNTARARLKDALAVRQSRAGGVEND